MILSMFSWLSVHRTSFPCRWSWSLSCCWLISIMMSLLRSSAPVSLYSTAEWEHLTVCVHTKREFDYSHDWIAYNVNANMRIEVNSHWAMRNTWRVCCKRTIFVSIASSAQVKKFHLEQKIRSTAKSLLTSLGESENWREHYCSHLWEPRNSWYTVGLEH